MANKQIERCFLCGKTKTEVNQLLRGKFGCVCDACIHEAYRSRKLAFTPIGVNDTDFSLAKFCGTEISNNGNITNFT